MSLSIVSTNGRHLSVAGIWKARGWGACMFLQVGAFSCCQSDPTMLGASSTPTSHSHNLSRSLNIISPTDGRAPGTFGTTALYLRMRACERQPTDQRMAQEFH